MSEKFRPEKDDRAYPQKALRIIVASAPGTKNAREFEKGLLYMFPESRNKQKQAN